MIRTWTRQWRIVLERLGKRAEKVRFKRFFIEFQILNVGGSYAIGARG